MIPRNVLSELRTLVLRNRGGDKFKVLPLVSFDSTALAAWDPHGVSTLTLLTYDRESWLESSPSIRAYLEANQLTWHEGFYSAESGRRKSWAFRIHGSSTGWSKPNPTVVCQSTDPRVVVDVEALIFLIDPKSGCSETEDGFRFWCTTMRCVEELRRRFLDCKRSLVVLGDRLYEYTVVFPDRVTDSTKHLDTDDTSSEFDALREQALWSSLWKWVPGMAWVHPDGRRGRVESTMPPIPGALPELLDAGTRGCMLDLIRYQYGEPRLSVIRNEDDFDWRVGWVGDYGGRFDPADSEIGALLNALDKPVTKPVFYPQ